MGAVWAPARSCLGVVEELSGSCLGAVSELSGSCLGLVWLPDCMRQLPDSSQTAFRQLQTAPATTSHHQPPPAPPSTTNTTITGHHHHHQYTSQPPPPAATTTSHPAGGAAPKSVPLSGPKTDPRNDVPPLWGDIVSGVCFGAGKRHRFWCRNLKFLMYFFAFFGIFNIFFWQF